MTARWRPTVGGFVLFVAPLALVLVGLSVVAGVVMWKMGSAYARPAEADCSQVADMARVEVSGRPDGLRLLGPPTREQVPLPGDRLLITECRGTAVFRGARHQVTSRYIEHADGRRRVEHVKGPIVPLAPAAPEAAPPGFR